MNDGMVTKGSRATDIFAVAEDVCESLKDVVASAAAFTAITKTTCSVEGHGVQTGTVKKSPISKAGIEARFHHMI
jgi:hypothetical protein